MKQDAEKSPMAVWLSPLTRSALMKAMERL
jgi:hypothetical protein